MRTAGDILGFCGLKSIVIISLFPIILPLVQYCLAETEATVSSPAKTKALMYQYQKDQLPVSAFPFRRNAKYPTAPPETKYQEFFGIFSMPGFAHEKRTANYSDVLVWIDDLYYKLQPLTRVDESQKSAHIENIQSKKKFQNKSNESIKDQMICPRCGNKLVLRTAAKGNHAGEQFWGCSRYPQCKYIKTIES